MTEQVEQLICMKFALSLNIPPWKLFGWFRSLQLWSAASSRQHAHSCITAHAEFFGETSNHSGDSTPVQPRYGALRPLAFPTTNISFEREEISDHWWYSGKHNRAADGDWENCVRSRGAYLEGDWGIIVLCTVFLVSSSINVSIFASTWLGTFWTDLIYFTCQSLTHSLIHQFIHSTYIYEASSVY